MVKGAESHCANALLYPAQPRCERWYLTKHDYGWGSINNQVSSCTVLDNTCLFLGAFTNCEKRLLALSCSSVRPFIRMVQLGSTGWIFIKFISVLFETLSRKFKIHWNLTKMTRTSYEDRHTLLITFCSIILRKSNIWNKIFYKNSKHAF
jgi:hypothetical protein